MTRLIQSERSAPGWRTLVLLLLALVVQAYPPAPHHLIYGLIRDEMGNPLTTPSAQVILESASGTQLVTRISAGVEPGVNYKLAVPMDAGITDDLYKPTALRPMVPFRIKVIIGKTSYLPMEMKGDYAHLGQPGQRTRLDLTLGEDSDGDGLPDAWERALIAQSGGKLKNLADVRPQDDFDGDGLSNLQEYLAGTYAFDNKDGFELKIVRLEGTNPVLEFTALRGRTYVIYGSADLQTWTAVGFRLIGDTANSVPLASYYATDVRLVRVEVPAQEGQVPMAFFKLLSQ